MGEERKVCKVLMGKHKTKRNSENRGIDGRMGSVWGLGRLVEGILLAQDKGWWQAAVNEVMNLQVWNLGNRILGCRLWFVHKYYKL
jgi:hypothetical protein